MEEVYPKNGISRASTIKHTKVGKNILRGRGGKPKYIGIFGRAKYTRYTVIK